MSAVVASQVRRTVLFASCALSLLAAVCGNAPSTTASDDASVALVCRVVEEDLLGATLATGATITPPAAAAPAAK